MIDCQSPRLDRVDELGPSVCGWAASSLLPDPIAEERRMARQEEKVKKCELFQQPVTQHWNVPKHLRNNLTAPQPSARFGHSAVVDPITEEMVCFGGRAQRCSDELWALDLDTVTWRQVPRQPGIPWPMARAGHTATQLWVAVNEGTYYSNRSVMVVIGGLSDTQAMAQPTTPAYGGPAVVGGGDDVWVYDHASASWCRSILTGPPSHYGATTPIPGPRKAHTAVLWEPSVSAAPFSATHPDLVRACHPHMPTRVHIVMYGGLLDAATFYDEVWVMSFAALRLSDGSIRYLHTWTLIPCMYGEAPTTRAYHVAHVHLDPLLGGNHKMIVFGGKCGSDFLSDVAELNLVTGAWRAVPTKARPPECCPFGTAASPAPRMCSASLLKNGQLAVFFGGSTEYYGDMFQLDLLTGEWVQSLYNCELTPPPLLQAAATLRGEDFHWSESDNDNDIAPASSAEGKEKKKKSLIPLHGCTSPTIVERNNVLTLFGGCAKDGFKNTVMQMRLGPRSLFNCCEEWFTVAQIHKNNQEGNFRGAGVTMCGVSDSAYAGGPGALHGYYDPLEFASQSSFLQSSTGGYHHHQLQHYFPHANYSSSQQQQIGAEQMYLGSYAVTPMFSSRIVTGRKQQGGATRRPPKNQNNGASQSVRVSPSSRKPYQRPMPAQPQGLRDALGLRPSHAEDDRVSEHSEESSLESASSTVGCNCTGHQQGQLHGSVTLNNCGCCSAQGALTEEERIQLPATVQGRLLPPAVGTSWATTRQQALPRKEGAQRGRSLRRAIVAVVPYVGAALKLASVASGQ